MFNEKASEIMFVGDKMELKEGIVEPAIMSSRELQKNIEIVNSMY